MKVGGAAAVAAWAARARSNERQELFGQTYTVIFEAGSLGLSLMPNVSGKTTTGQASGRRMSGFDHGAVVEDLTREGGVAGQAERSGLVAPGHHITAINGESTMDLTFDKTLQKLSAAARPVQIVFEVPHARGTGAHTGQGTFRDEPRCVLLAEVQRLTQGVEQAYASLRHARKVTLRQLERDNVKTQCKVLEQEQAQEARLATKATAARAHDEIVRELEAAIRVEAAKKQLMAKEVRQQRERSPAVARQCDVMKYALGGIEMEAGRHAVSQGEAASYRERGARRVQRMLLASLRRQDEAEVAIKGAQAMRGRFGEKRQEKRQVRTPARLFSYI